MGLTTTIACGNGGVATNTSLANVAKCGPNSLFVFLILTGHSGVRLEQFEDIPISSDGATLLALKGAARKFRVETEVRRYSPEDIGSLHLPAIGQFNASGSATTSHHFNVIYKVDAERVYVIDGTTAEKRVIPRSKLAATWTGVAMTEKRPLGLLAAVEGLPILLVACLIIIDLVILTSWIRWVRCRENKGVIAEEQVVA